FAGAPGGIPLVCPLGNTTINCGIQRIFLQTSLQPITAPLDPSQFPGTVQSQNLNFKQGKVQQFNLNVERQIPGNVVLTVGYAGSRGNHILVAGNNLNTFGPSTCSVGTIGCNADGTPFSPGFAVGNAVLGFVDYGKTTYDSL